MGHRVAVVRRNGDLMSSPSGQWQPPPLRPRRRSVWVLLGGVSTLLLIVAVVLAVAVVRNHFSDKAASVPTFGPPQELLSDLNMPRGVVVDDAGNIYVADAGNHRVMRYTAGEVTGKALPFDSHVFPTGLAVDSSGAVYIIDSSSVLKLAPDAAEPTELPFGRLGRADSVAVDSVGNVYVTNDANDGGEVLQLAPGASIATVISVDGLQTPKGLAVDNADNIYVVDFDGRTVVKLAAGDHEVSRLPFGDRSYLQGIAVDSVGTVYVTQTDLDADQRTGRVFALPAGADSATELVTGLEWVDAVALDSAGNLYVTDGNPDKSTGRVMKYAVT